MSKFVRPDFEAIFFDTFSKQFTGVFFRARNDSNFNHDIHFIHSLINDAKFQLGDISHQKQTLEIKLSRARWELREEIKKYNLIEIPSLLRFTRVRKIEFASSNLTLSSPFSGHLFEEGDEISKNTSCEIDNFFIGESTYTKKSQHTELVLMGYPGNWLLRIFMDFENAGVSLKDLGS